EDGIRDRNVTGVQTCALPICGQDFRATEFTMVDSINYMRPCWCALQSAHARFTQVLVQRWPTAETKFAKLEQVFANGRQIGSLGRERFSKSNHDSIRDCSGQLLEKASALKRED